MPPTPLPPSLPNNATSEDSMRAWVDLMKASEKLVKAGLRIEVGDDDLEEAYRAWFARRVEIHSLHIQKLARRLATAGE